MRSIADDVAAGRLRASAVSEKLIARRLYQPEMPDVDLFIRSSGEQRTSNFLLWESAYAEYVFLDTLWPDFSGQTCGERSTSTLAGTAASAERSTLPSLPL